MASDKKFYTTPIGIVGAYPYIQRPDTQFNDRGEYRIKLAVPTNKAQRLINLITEAHEKNLEALKKNPKYKGKRIKEGDMPFYEDDEGNVVFTFKMYASFKDRETGDMKDLTLRVYDSVGKRIEDVPAISGGSEGRVEFSLFPYPPSGAVGASVKLQLSKFQLLKLVEWTGGGNDTFGADEDDEDMSQYAEGGYVAQSKPKDSFGSDEDEYQEEEEYEGEAEEEEDF